MSFILDALKKSEKERQRAAVPSIGDLPIIVQQARTSSWVYAVIAALGLGLIWLTWISWPDSAPAPLAASQPQSPAASAGADPAAPATAALEPPRTRSLASEATRMPATSSPRGTAAAPQPSPAPAARPIVTAAPMSIFEARAAGVAVPDLVLELLVYSDDPAQRFVFINASKYVEGDALAEGPRVVEISTEGAILSHNGRNFLLPQE